MLNIPPDYSVANRVFLSDLLVTRTSQIFLTPFIHGVVSAEPRQFTLTFFAASQLGFAPGEHFLLTDGTVSELLPGHVLLIPAGSVDNPPILCLYCVR